MSTRDKIIYDLFISYNNDQPINILTVKLVNIYIKRNASQILNVILDLLMYPDRDYIKDQITARHKKLTDAVVNDLNFLYLYITEYPTGISYLDESFRVHVYKEVSLTPVNEGRTSHIKFEVPRKTFIKFNAVKRDK